MVPLTLSVLLGFGLLMLLAQVSNPLAEAKKARHVTELILGAILLMTVTRHQVRGLYLAVSGATGQPVIAPQWGIFFVFLATFVLCIGLVIFAVIKAVQDRPTKPEDLA